MNDFNTVLRENIAWPWSSTHFILSETCVGCRNSTDGTSNAKPSHFKLIMNRKDIKKLIETNWFWCKICKYVAVYDHYPEDECEYCNTSM